MLRVGVELVDFGLLRPEWRNVAPSPNRFLPRVPWRRMRARKKPQTSKTCSFKEDALDRARVDSPNARSTQRKTVLCRGWWIFKIRRPTVPPMRNQSVFPPKRFDPAAVYTFNEFDVHSTVELIEYIDLFFELADCTSRLGQRQEESREICTHLKATKSAFVKKRLACCSYLRCRSHAHGCASYC